MHAMIQTVIAFLLVVWAALYALWHFMPAGWRSRLVQLAAPLLGRKLAASVATTTRATNCRSCAGCKGCD